MFKQRLITALILIPLVLLAIEKANGWLLGALLVMCLGLAANEWMALIPIRAITYKVLLFIALVGGAFLSLTHVSMVLFCGLVLWFFMDIAIITYPASQKIWGYRIAIIFCYLVFLSLTFTCIFAMYHLSQGKDLLIYLLFLVWAADSGAYFVGKRWGKHRLIPHVSPGKTVEGALGGMVSTLLIALLGYLWFKPASVFIWYSLAFFIWLQAMMGDLFFSMLKRRVHLKDTGNLLPGHGGILDRIDSLIAVAPLFYAVLLWANPL